jgi:hypothetical protein
MFVECLLDRGESTVSLDILIPVVSSRANLRRSSVCVCWCPSGDVGLIQRVGPAFVAGATMEHDASDTMSPRFPKAPTPKWVSIARAFAWSKFRMA